MVGLSGPLRSRRCPPSVCDPLQEREIRELKDKQWLFEGRERVLGRLDQLTKDDRLFFLSYGLFLVISILNTSFFYRYYEGKPCMWLQILCMALLAAYEYRNGFLRAQQWGPGLVLAAMTLLSLRVTVGSMTRMVPMMFPYIYCARRIPFPKIVRFTLKYSIITVAVIVASSMLGVIDNVVEYRSGRVREYLGFRYALYLPGILLNMTLLWIYLKKYTVSLTGTLLWATLNWIVFLLTDSRISFVMAEVMLVVALVMRWLPGLVRKLRPAFVALIPSFLLFGGFSLLMTLMYDRSVKWMRQLNSFLEGRLNLGQKSLEKYGVSMFGKAIEWVGNGLDSAGNSMEATYDYVDCLYVKVLQQNGILFTVVLAMLLTWSMYALWKRREYHILIISAVVAAHCILDDLSFTLHYNTFWIANGLVIIAPAMLDWNGKTNQVRKRRKMDLPIDENTE